MVRFIEAVKFKTMFSLDTSMDIKFTCIIDKETILIGRSSNYIEEYKLQKNGQTFVCSNSFNSIGDITHMIFSSTGNYIATIETDSYRLPVVRVYVNWQSNSSHSNSYFNQIRVRVANRVTPTLNTTDQNIFEMIELPLPESNNFPVAIACCKMSGNIAIAQNDKIIVFYKFFYNSKCDKLVYVDFILMDIYIILDYIPKELTISENIIVLKSLHNLNVFKIVKHVDSTEILSDSGINGKYMINNFDSKMCVLLFY